jgi:hypothetical protein
MPRGLMPYFMAYFMARRCSSMHGSVPAIHSDDASVKAETGFRTRAAWPDISEGGHVLFSVADSSKCPHTPGTMHWLYSHASEGVNMHVGVCARC